MQGAIVNVARRRSDVLLETADGSGLRWCPRIRSRSHCTHVYDDLADLPTVEQTRHLRATGFWRTCNVQGRLNDARADAVRPRADGITVGWRSGGWGGCWGVTLTSSTDLETH